MALYVTFVRETVYFCQVTRVLINLHERIQVARPCEGRDMSSFVFSPLNIIGTLTKTTDKGTVVKRDSNILGIGRIEMWYFNST